MWNEINESTPVPYFERVIITDECEIEIDGFLEGSGLFVPIDDPEEASMYHVAACTHWQYYRT